MKEKIKQWYKQGLWTKEMIQNAIEKNPSILTKKEYSEIVQEADET